MNPEANAPLAGAIGGVWRAAWESLSKGRTEGIDPADFRLGWQAAMKSICDRLPAPLYARDPMTPREVERLLNYVRANLPPNAPRSATGANNEGAKQHE